MSTIFAGPSSSILHFSSSDNAIFTHSHFIYSFKLNPAVCSRRRPRVSLSSSSLIAAVAQSRQQTGGGGISTSAKSPSFPLSHHRTSKEKKSNDVFEDDPIADLNARIRRDQSKRKASGRTSSSSSSSMDPAETDKYIQLVKMQQQRGLQKLKGDRRSMMAGTESATQEKQSSAGFSYKVDPYTLRSGDYVVHKKVGVGRFVAIKNDIPVDSSVPIEYVFIEFGDGMAKLPVKQAARFLYRYNLDTHSFLLNIIPTTLEL